MPTYFPWALREVRSARFPLGQEMCGYFLNGDQESASALNCANRSLMGS